LYLSVFFASGYKLSALEIETKLLLHPSISEVAVIGKDDAEWGQRVAAIVTTVGNASLELVDLRKWCRDQMAAYKIPKDLHVVPSIPRNAMGKINKKTLMADLGLQLSYCME
jgi:malonyl-CoA/methylmalonyl-CoA synthetase